MRIRSLAALLIGLTSIGPAGQSLASSEAWIARLVQSSQASVPPGTRVTLDCFGSMPTVSGSAGAGGAAIFVDVAFENSFFTQLAEISRDVAVTSTGGPIEFGITGRDTVPSTSGEQRIVDFFSEASGLLRAAWATWGYDGYCSLALDGLPLPTTNHEPSSGALYYSENFDGSGTPTFAVRPAAETLGDSYMSRNVSTSSFVFLINPGWISESYVTATSPGGRVFDPDDLGSSAIVLRGTDDPGEWNFAAGGWAVGAGLPPVAIVELAGYPITLR